MNEKDQMLMSLLKCRRVDLAVGSEELTVAQKSEFSSMVERRAQGEPLQYIIGHCDFMGTSLYIDKSVLIPRPETELLVELAIAKIKSLIRSNRAPHILDLGTGSGNIAVTIAKHFPKSSITAIDRHESALTLARKNAEENSVEKRITFLCKDMINYLKEAFARNMKFDVIISNPPYIKTSDLGRLPSDVRQEPQHALDGGSDGLMFIRSIIQYANQILKPNGFLLLEIGDDQSEITEVLLKKYSLYKDVSIHKDYVGTNRMVTAQVA